MQLWSAPTATAEGGGMAMVSSQSAQVWLTAAVGTHRPPEQVVSSPQATPMQARKRKTGSVICWCGMKAVVRRATAQPTPCWSLGPYSGARHSDTGSPRAATTDTASLSLRDPLGTSTSEPTRPSSPQKVVVAAGSRPSTPPTGPICPVLQAGSSTWQPFKQSPEPMQT